MKSAFPGPPGSHRLRLIAKVPSLECYELRDKSFTYAYFRGPTHQSVALALDEYSRLYPSGGYYTKVKFGPKELDGAYEARIERYSSCE